MTRPKQRGSVQFCIDLSSIPPGTPLESHHQTQEVTFLILKALERSDLRVTWSLPPTAPSRLLDALRAGGQEPALAATSTWFSSAHRRSDIERTLRDTQERHSASGRPLCALVTRSSLPESYLEMLWQQGFHVLRQGSVERGWRGVPARVGRLWRIPVTATLPGRGRFLARWDSRFRVKAAIHRALTQKTTEHASVDIRDISVDGRSPISIRSLDQLFRLIHRLVRADRLHVETLTMAASRWAPTVRQRRQHSILRPAA